MRLKIKNMNIQTLVELSSYLAFIVLMLYLVFSGKYKMYVTQKTVPYFYFTAAVFSLWSVFSLRRLFRVAYKNRIYHSLILWVPVMLFLLPHDLVQKSNFELGADSKIVVAEAAPEVKNEEKEIERDALWQGLDEEVKFIYVSDEEFGAWYTELSANGKKYDGYTVKIRGSILKSSEFMAENEFTISRLLMTCCVADVAPGGILCEYDDVSELAGGDWYGVEGKLKIESRTGYDIPRILVTSVEKIQPIEGYAYP